MKLTRESLFELVGYGLGTVIAFAVDFGLLTLLVAKLHVHYVVAAGISFLSGAVVLYLLSVRYVFHHRRLATARAELPAFVALGLVGLLVQSLIMTFAVEHLHLHYLAAKSVSAVCTFAVNFTLRQWLLFSGTRVSADHVTPRSREQQT